MMNLETMKCVLERFGLEHNHIFFEPIQQTISECKIKLIYLVKDLCNHQWVCRYYWDKSYPKSLIEQQSCFATMLRENGIITPKKYQSDGYYCIDIKIGDKIYSVTVEEFLENDIFYIDDELFGKLGRLLGKLHCISEKEPVKIDYSVISHSFASNTASFDKILSKAYQPIKRNSCINDIQQLHDNLIVDLKNQWFCLPNGVVNGDLSVFNNIINVNGELGIIDFDLAGNEVYLGDMLISFYSSLYKFTTKSRYSKYHIQKAYDLFFDGYFSKRTLKDIEVSNFAKVSALFDGLYFCKAIIDKWNHKPDTDVLKHFDEAYQHFDVAEHNINFIK